MRPRLFYARGQLCKNFNPRTREGCDVRPCILHNRHFYFNPRTREGCDGVESPNRMRAVIFQSTHPRRVRHVKEILKMAKRNISIHAPAKGATDLYVGLVIRGKNFNPRTREGCDQEQSVILKNFIDISIHAPAKGATMIIRNYFGSFSNFNPRTREGCDPLVALLIVRIVTISIHAPAKGATVCSSGFKALIFSFQSTHPRRVRPSILHLQGNYNTNFNPRTREGCDNVFAWSILRMTFISIHAPAKGATSIHWVINFLPVHFNPRTREGCD